jgi:hypothetical protein
MKKDPRLYLAQILERIARIKEYTASGKQAFFADRRTQDAVIRNFEVILSVLQESQEVRILGLDAKGIVQSNHVNKVFDNCTVQTMGIRMDAKGSSVAHGYFKYMDQDGDIFIMEGIMAEGEKAATMKFIYGTGKWKGIKGEGKDQQIARGKPITPGTAQMCFRHTGTFELPK